MGNLFFSLIALVLFALAAYGWGRPLAVWCHGQREPFGWAYPVALGMTSWLLLGGMLNALGWAYAPALWGILAAGWLLWAASLKKWWTCGGVPIPNGPAEWARLLPGILLAVLTVFWAATLMPSVAFNWHDDLTTYFARPVRMLAVGSLAHSPFQLLGADSMGGQAFFHAFSRLTFPATYLNAFDTVFCFGLGGALVVALARSIGIATFGAVVGVALFALVHPQIVNTSALYSGVVMNLALAYASLLMVRSLGDSTRSKAFRQGIPAGLILGGMMTLKITFAAYAAVYAVVCIVLMLLSGLDRRQVVIAVGGSVGAAVVMLLPWVILHADNFTTAMQLYAAGADEHGGASGVMLANLSAYWSTKKLSWGGAQWAYTLAFAMIAVSTLVASALVARRTTSDKALIIAGATGMAATAAFLVNGAVFDGETAVRYSCTALITALPLMVVVVIRVAGRFSRHYEPVVALVALAVVVVMFGATLNGRLVRAASHHTTLNFAEDGVTAGYIKFATGPLSRVRLGAAQAKTEAGEGIFSYIMAPFWLDQRRNPVMIATEAGMAAPWIAPLGDAAAFREYLMGQGVRYIFWEYIGWAVRPDSMYSNFAEIDLHQYRRIGQNNLMLRQHLDRYSKSFATIYEDFGLIVLDLAIPLASH